MNSIGERIKAIRKECNLTQKDLADLLGLQVSAISKYETGRVIPDEKAIKLIVSTYHVNATWLVKGEGDMMEELDTDALVEKYMAGQSEWAKSIMKSFARLPDKEWYEFRDMIERIKKEGHL